MTKELNAKRFAAKPLRQPAYDFRTVPKCQSDLKGSVISEVTDRDHLFESMAEMVLLCKEAVRRGAEKRKKDKFTAAKPLSLEYMADRIDVDDPLFGYLVRHNDRLQGFITVTTFTNWQKSFCFDSLHDSAFSFDEPTLAAQMANQERAYDSDGSLAEAMQATVRCGDPWNEGIVWPRIAEISLLGGLGCGKTLVSLVIEKLERMNSTGSRNYDYVVLQATDNSVPFYESLGFVRVGCITEDLDFEKRMRRQDEEDEEKKEDPLPEVVSSDVTTYVTQKQGEHPVDLAKRFHCDVWDIIFLNQYVYPDIAPRSRLIKGTSLFIPTKQAKRKNDCDGDTPTWYIAKENDTPRKIAKMFQVSWQDVIAGNRARFPELQSNSRLKDGTRIKVSHFHVSDDAYQPYCHWTFPTDTLETSEPSYMMALKLNRKKAARAKLRKPVEESLAVSIQEKYEPPKDSTYQTTPATMNGSKVSNSAAAPSTAAASRAVVTAPVRPKRPLSGYLLFCRDHRHLFKETMAGKPLPELTKVLSRQWQELDERYKQKYQAMHLKEREAYQKAKTAYEVELAVYREAYPDLSDSSVSQGGLFNKVVKLVNYNSTPASELFDYYYVLTYIPDLQWCHLAPMRRVGLWGPDKPQAEGRPIWMLVDEAEGKELDVSSSFCEIVKARSMKRTVDADQEQWDIPETSGAGYDPSLESADVLAHLQGLSVAPAVKRGRGRPRIATNATAFSAAPQPLHAPKRKRGRPPKVKPESDRARLAAPISLPPGETIQPLPALKRKRGRPPKVKPESDVARLAAPPSLPLGKSLQPLPAPKRKRGRPPKVKPSPIVAEADADVGETKLAAPPPDVSVGKPLKKKRGWPLGKPRKARPSSCMKSFQNEAANPQKRKRGRPRKVVQETSSPPQKRQRLPLTPQRIASVNGDVNPRGVVNAPQTRRKQGPFVVGDVVEVQSRTWPGINKPGGVGRVKHVDRRDNGTIVYAVSYVLGGRERNIDAAFVLGEEEPIPTDSMTRTSPRVKVTKSLDETGVSVPSSENFSSEVLAAGNHANGASAGKGTRGAMNGADDIGEEAPATKRIRCTPLRKAAPKSYTHTTEKSEDEASKEASRDSDIHDEVVPSTEDGSNTNQSVRKVSPDSQVEGGSNTVKMLAPVFLRKSKGVEDVSNSLPQFLTGGRGVRRVTRASA